MSKLSHSQALVVTRDTFQEEDELDICIWEYKEGANYFEDDGLWMVEDKDGNSLLALSTMCITDFESIFGFHLKPGDKQYVFITVHNAADHLPNPNTEVTYITEE